MRLGKAGFSDALTVPFFKTSSYCRSDCSFVVFGMVVIAGAGNAVNLTDGLDGLAIVPVMITAATFGLIAYLTGNAKFARICRSITCRNAGELAIICGALIGAGLGFLWFNAPPAMIFMGDTGSLALGGALGAIAVATKHEIVLAIAGGLFVLEALSVIIQVASFKMTGKRVFRMAPLHHHFEQKGWQESDRRGALLDHLGGAEPRRALDPEIALIRPRAIQPEFGYSSPHDSGYHIRRAAGCRVRPRCLRQRNRARSHGRRSGRRCLGRWRSVARGGGQGRRADRGPQCADWSTFAALVLAPGVPLTHPEPHWTVKRARAAGVEVIGDIELFFRERAALCPEARSSPSPAPTANRRRRR